MGIVGAWDSDLQALGRPTGHWGDRMGIRTNYWLRAGWYSLEGHQSGGAYDVSIYLSSYRLPHTEFQMNGVAGEVP